MHRRLAVLALLALVPCALQAAEPVAACGVEAPPLLYAIMSFRTPAGLVPYVVTRSFFLLQGGPTLVVETARPPDSIRPAEVGVICSRTDLVDYREMVAAMAAARVGLQGNCQARPSGADIPEEETLFQWFGRGRRQNTFVVTSRETGDPPCPAAVVALVRELTDYFFALQRAGTRQTLAVPTARVASGPTS